MKHFSADGNSLMLPSNSTWGLTVWFDEYDNDVNHQHICEILDPHQNTEWCQTSGGVSEAPRSDALSWLFHVISHLSCLFVFFGLLSSLFSPCEILESLMSSYRPDTPTQAPPPPPPPSHSYVALMQTQAISDKLLSWQMESSINRFQIPCDKHK